MKHRDGRKRIKFGGNQFFIILNIRNKVAVKPKAKELHKEVIISIMCMQYVIFSTRLKLFVFLGEQIYIHFTDFLLCTVKFKEVN